MKRLVFLCLLVAMAAISSTAYGQLTIQDNEQIAILNRQVYQQKLVVMKLQDKLTTLKKLDSASVRDNNSLDELESLDSVRGLSVKEKRQYATLLSKVKQNKEQRNALVVEHPALQEELEAEQSTLTVLKGRKDAILTKATTNTETPKEVGAREKKLRDRGFDVKERDANVDYDIEIKKASLNLLKSGNTANVVSADSSVKTSFPVRLINYSRVNVRMVTIKGKRAGETQSFLLQPNERQTIYLLPQEYTCDIQDLQTNRIDRGNHLKVSLTKHSIEGALYNGGIFAVEYF